MVDDVAPAAGFLALELALRVLVLLDDAVAPGRRRCIRTAIVVELVIVVLALELTRIGGR